MGKAMIPKEIRGLSTRERVILGEFMRRGRVTIMGQDVSKAFNLAPPIANKILLRLERKGWLQRGKRGVYVFVPLSSLSPETMPEDPWALAMEFFAPCFISGFSAAAYWELTEQIFNTIVVYSSRPQRSTTQKLANVTFRLHRIAEGKMFGTRKIWRNNIPVLVADPHRTLIDVLDCPVFGGGGRHALDIAYAYWKSDKADPDLLLQYALRLNRGVIFKRLGFSGESWGVVTKEWRETCREHVSAGISKLDPSGPGQGKILTRWGLRINLPLEEYA
jgi:predicted transcriptional regulator of viral defense system